MYTALISGPWATFTMERGGAAVTTFIPLLATKFVGVSCSDVAEQAQSGRVCPSPNVGTWHVEITDDALMDIIEADEDFLVHWAEYEEDPPLEPVPPLPEEV